MGNLGSRLQEAVDHAGFPEDLEYRIDQAKSTPHAMGPVYPDFDNYMLTPLGWAVGRELARVTAASTRSFGQLPSEANQYVPMWVADGSDYLYGKFPAPIDEGIFNPFREPGDEIQQAAVRIARNCIRNASGAVLDANIVIRSMFNMLLERPDYERKRAYVIIEKSTALIARLAMINDTRVAGDDGFTDPEFMRPIPGRSQFEQFVGIDNRVTGVIQSEHLVLDPEHGLIDLSADAKRVAKENSLAGGGCPSRNIPVCWRGRVMPMLMAFWSGSVETTQDRIEQSLAIPFLF